MTIPAQKNFVSLINVETLIASNHPLRVIKRMLDEVLRAMSGHFDEIYAADGAPSVPPETLLKAKVLQALYTVRSDRQWCDRLQIATPEQSDGVRTIFAAPAEYWDRVSGKRGPAWRVRRPAWEAILRLMQALAERQLPVSLVRLEAIDPETPRGISASLVDPASLV